MSRDRESGHRAATAGAGRLPGGLAELARPRTPAGAAGSGASDSGAGVGSRISTKHSAAIDDRFA